MITVTMVKRENLHPTETNPSSRVEKKILKGIKNSIAQYGILMPLTITKDYQIVDGHRRFASACELEIPELPCIIRDTDTDALFDALNGYTRPINGRERLDIFVTSGYKLESIPSNKRKDYTRLLSFLTKEDLDNVSTTGKEPVSVMNLLPGILSYLEYEDTPENKRKIFLWMITTSSTQPVRRAMKAHVPHNKIVQFIEKGQPLPY